MRALQAVPQGGTYLPMLARPRVSLQQAAATGKARAKLCPTGRSSLFEPVMRSQAVLVALRVYLTQITNRRWVQLRNKSFLWKSMGIKSWSIAAVIDVLIWVQPLSGGAPLFCPFPAFKSTGSEKSLGTQCTYNCASRIIEDIQGKGQGVGGDSK